MPEPPEGEEAAGGDVSTTAGERETGGEGETEGDCETAVEGETPDTGVSDGLSPISRVLGERG